MADRTMNKGDTWPPFKGEASDETGLLDLTVATALDFVATSPAHQITGTAVAIDPAEADADGIHHWNWKYEFQAGDTDETGTYEANLKVTWAPGQIETFPNTGGPKLVIED
jgi:hypothetical protein